MALKSKILIIGPPEVSYMCVNKSVSPLKYWFVSYQAGKTALSNFLSESTEAYTVGDYYPTKGVRILEFESNETVDGKLVRVDIELWDCGGSQE